MITEKYIHEIIGDIVDTLRAVGTITDVVLQPNGLYLFTAENEFEANDFITITNDNNETFENVQIIEANTGSFLSDTDIGYNVAYNYSFKANKPYYMHEKQPKANEVLTQKNESNRLKWQKYPLVLLVRPFTIDARSADYVKADLRIAIVDITKSEYNSDQRYENVITPILEPIYDGLLAGIVDSEQVVLWGIDYIQHDRNDELFIEGNPLPDLLDGIYVEFFELPFKRKC